MARFESDDQARRLGEALAALRRQQGLSQAEAGSRAGMTSQGWGLYEAGRRSGLYRPDVQQRLTAALGSTPEALLLELTPIAGAPEPTADGVRSGGREFRGAVPSPVQSLTLEDDTLAPWAEKGVILDYQPGRRPRPGQGCVIHLADGRRHIGLLGAEDDQGLTLTIGEPRHVRHGDIRAIGTVLARREPQ